MKVAKSVFINSLAILLLGQFAPATAVSAEDAVEVITDPVRAWETISRYFEPPIAYRYDFGLYPSPLTLADGSAVVSPEDWQRRRKDILEAWHRIMGPWPPLIESPRLEMVRSEKRAGFTKQWVRVEVQKGKSSDGYLLIPDGYGPFPAVVVVFYEPETSIGEKREYLAFGLQLARRGYVTLQLNPLRMSDEEREDAGLQHLSFLAYQAANTYNTLANMPYVDPKRVAIIGHSFGGKWAMFSACLYDKYAAGVWIAPGIVFDESEGNSNYWTAHYLGAKPSAYLKLKEEGRGLLELQALMSPRPFFVSAGSPDHDPTLWRMLNHLVRLNKLLGYENRVAMSNRPPHSPSLSDNEDIYRFFDVFLKHRKTDRVEPSPEPFDRDELAAPVLARLPEERMSKYVDRQKDFTDYDLVISFELLPWDGIEPGSAEVETGPESEPMDLGLYYRASSPDNGLKITFTASNRPTSGEPRWELLKIKDGRAEVMTDPIRDEPATLPSPLHSGKRYWLRFKLTWSHAAAKVWPRGEPEPLAWPLVAEDLEFTGGMLLMQYYPTRVRYDKIIMNGSIIPLESVLPYHRE